MSSHLTFFTDFSYRSFLGICTSFLFCALHMTGPALSCYSYSCFSLVLYPVYVIHSYICFSQCCRVLGQRFSQYFSLKLVHTLSWKEHIFDLTSRLNKACYTTRVIKSFMTLNVLRTVYFSYFHLVMSYGVIFWGNSHLSNNIFKIQKRTIRIITNSGRYDSCRQLFKQLQILTLPSQYMFSLLVFVAKNRHLFLSNSDIHDKNVHHNCNLHLPTTN
jgi:hypothetical protein